MTDWRERVVSDPDIMFGKPVIAGTRIPVEHILRKLAENMSVEAIQRDYPSLTPEDILAATAYASGASCAEVTP